MFQHVDIEHAVESAANQVADAPPDWLDGQRKRLLLLALAQLRKQLSVRLQGSPTLLTAVAQDARSASQPGADLQNVPAHPAAQPASEIGLPAHSLLEQRQFAAGVVIWQQGDGRILAVHRSVPPRCDTDEAAGTHRQIGWRRELAERVRQSDC